MLTLDAIALDSVPRLPLMLMPSETLFVMFRLLRFTPVMPPLYVSTQTQRAAPSVSAGIVTPATNDVTTLDHRGSAENIPAHGKGGADQDAAVVGGIEKLAVFNPVVGATVNGPAVGQTWLFRRAVGDDVIPEALVPDVWSPATWRKQSSPVPRVVQLVTVVPCIPQLS